MSAGGRASWIRPLEVDEDYHVSGLSDSDNNDENVAPVLGNEVERLVENRILVRCPSRRQPRIPLRDVTHLFYGNIALEDKVEPVAAVRLPLGTIRFQRRSTPVPNLKPTRKRRHTQHATERAAAKPTSRNVLRKTFR